MKFLKFTIEVALLALALNSLALFASSDVDEDMEDYMSECNAPVELYDPEAMASTMASPEKFIQLVESINNPATVNTLIECATHPEQVETILQSLRDPIKYMNMMIIFMNPQTYMNWMAASTNPEFNQSEFEVINAPAMVETFEKLYKLLTAIQADSEINSKNHN
jgi:hypothetical protein